MKNPADFGGFLLFLLFTLWKFCALMMISKYEFALLADAVGKIDKI